MKKATDNLIHDPDHGELVIMSNFAGCVELKAFSKTSCKSQWFKDVGSLLERANEWEGEGITLACSQSQPAVECTEDGDIILPSQTLRDADVSVYCRLLFDFDRVENRGRNASERELTAALKLRDDFAALMMDFGWPEPVLATSGNGGHALYRAYFINSPEMRDSLKRLYTGLGTRFRNDVVKFDTTTYSAGQFCRLYGFKNRKYPHSMLHPQRIARIESAVGDSVELMMAEAVTEACKEFGEQPAVIQPPRPVVPYIGKGADWKTLDIVGWFRSQGLYLRDMGGGKHAVYCPWQQLGEHEKSCGSDTVIWETSRSGYPTFSCSHDTCHGRGSLRDLSSVMAGINQHCTKPRVTQ